MRKAVTDEAVTRDGRDGRDERDEDILHSNGLLPTVSTIVELQYLSIERTRDPYARHVVTRHGFIRHGFP